jgi:hypothetical protein
VPLEKCFDEPKKAICGLLLMVKVKTKHFPRQVADKMTKTISRMFLAFKLE